MRVPVGRAGAAGVLLELQRLSVVIARPRVVAAISERVERAVPGVPGIRAERRPVASGAAGLVHLGLTAVVADDRPALGARTVSEGNALDLQRRELEPGRDVV